MEKTSVKSLVPGYTLDQEFIGRPHEWDPRRLYSQVAADWQHRVDVDRLRKERLAKLPIQPELREAFVRLYWLQRSPHDGQGRKVKAILVQKVVCSKLEPEWFTWYRKATKLINTTVRASSAVESVNSVLRMHQSRHRTLNQVLLDLKRLYYNTRRFRKGPRRGKCPYQLLGLKLPTYEFWTILQGQMDHESAIATPRPLCRASPC